jgi:hypothetical protein
MCENPYTIITAKKRHGKKEEKEKGMGTPLAVIKGECCPYTQNVRRFTFTASPTK